MYICKIEILYLIAKCIHHRVVLLTNQKSKLDYGNIVFAKHVVSEYNFNCFKIYFVYPMQIQYSI